MGQFKKGFIEYGGDPTPAYLADQTNFLAVNACPIDGVVLRPMLNSGLELSTNTLTPTSYTLSDLSASLSYLAVRNGLGWGDRAVHNFAKLQISSPTGTVIDWFDSDIEHFINNMSLIGRFAAEADLQGVWFDAEGYIPQWTYNEMPAMADHTFQQYAERAEQAGYAVAANWLRYNPDMQAIFTEAYNGYVNDGGATDSNPWGFYKSFLDGVHNAFGVQRSTFTSVNSCCKEFGTESKNSIILTSELSYGCLNQDCLQDALDQTNGVAGDDYKGGSDYFGLVDQFGLALWITYPTFDPNTPLLNHFTPDGFKASLNQFMVRSGVGWIYNPQENACFYGHSIPMPQDYLDAMFEVRAAHGLP